MKKKESQTRLKFHEQSRGSNIHRRSRQREEHSDDDLTREQLELIAQADTLPSHNQQQGITALHKMPAEMKVASGIFGFIIMLMSYSLPASGTCKGKGRMHV